jgi:hypothetical protein
VTLTPRLRLVLVAGVAVLALVGTTAYVLLARHRAAAQVANTTPVKTRDDVARLSAGAHIVFRNTALGDGYGRVAVVPLTNPGGPRAIAPPSCERMYARAGSVLCLSANRGLVTTFKSQLFDRAWQPVRELPLVGLPSRARLSPDGSLAATTTFVYGDSYANQGQFSTRTVVSRTDGSASQELETFQLTVDGKPLTVADRNLWGVTFADDDHFYATAASGGHTWLVRGSLSARTLVSIHVDAECPSLSPDGTRVVIKTRGNLPPGQWRLAVYNLASGAETPLAETRSVDDQAEWLDDTHVVYGLPRRTAGTASSDIWVTPADGTGSPSLLISDAWSPAVVR